MKKNLHFSNKNRAKRRFEKRRFRTLLVVADGAQAVALGVQCVDVVGECLGAQVCLHALYDPLVALGEGGECLGLGVGGDGVVWDRGVTCLRELLGGGVDYAHPVHHDVAAVVRLAALVVVSHNRVKIASDSSIVVLL